MALASVPFSFTPHAPPECARPGLLLMEGGSEPASHPPAQQSQPRTPWNLVSLARNGQNTIRAVPGVWKWSFLLGNS